MPLAPDEIIGTARLLLLVELIVMVPLLAFTFVKPPGLNPLIVAGVDPEVLPVNEIVLVPVSALVAAAATPKSLVRPPVEPF